jgi:hypothetical protein
MIIKGTRKQGWFSRLMQRFGYYYVSEWTVVDPKVFQLEVPPAPFPNYETPPHDLAPFVCRCSQCMPVLMRNMALIAEQYGSSTPNTQDLPEK